MEDFERILFEKKAIEDFKQSMKTIGKQIASIEVIDIPKVDWFLVWDTGSLKPTISCDEESSWENKVRLPEEFSNFINFNYERR